MNPLALSMPGSEALGEALAEGLPADTGTMDLHVFPDRETYVRIESPVADRDVLLVTALDAPDSKLVPLFLVASTLSSLGARNIVLVAPYLPYLRQDRVFRPGEGLSSSYIAHWFSGFADGLVTVEPHLHRIAELTDVFSIPCEVVGAADSIARWVGENVSRPMIVGPAMESRQWSDSIARALECPSIFLHRIRIGDSRVEVSIPDLTAYTDFTPVLVDDIVSSGQTMAMAVRRLRSAGFPQPVCIGVHALFGQATVDLLRSAGAERIVSCNGLKHPSNAVDLDRAIVAATRSLLRRLPRPRQA
ncbi:ribose-phosphate diphosphokinase [Solimonas sp. SE-A11]|uniref:ribose-phosphate diphosphokinase n=1 Tax=Solimonas sp. SE-A11 TaxID=3054954 RepID=UPI00259D05D7|nr:ribose-phosphate diphosphokinase [Solimonas sp. SE-A11]MDM4769115.1 ribose-phosphate diphosphokinase [Solimonas sp. SE-A11]